MEVIRERAKLWLTDRLTSSGQAHLLLAVQGAVLADTVIDNDGIVDGVAQDGQQGSNKVAVQGNAQEDKDAEDDEHIVQQSHNGGREPALSPPILRKR